jgi:hypothetical protein
LLLLLKPRLALVRARPTESTTLAPALLLLLLWLCAGWPNAALANAHGVAAARQAGRASQRRLAAATLQLLPWLLLWLHARVLLLLLLACARAKL